VTLATRQQDAVENTRTLQALCGRVSSELRKALGLLGTITDEDYRASRSRRGSVGAHVRHNLDMIACLLNGIEKGRIDYSARERDELIETDRAYAARKVESTVSALEDLARADVSALVVRSETERDLWLASTLERELEFVHSHTVHHHALIAEKLAVAGFELDESFGVAPSTLSFWNENSAGR